MVIKKLILHNYKRFFLNNISTLEYTPESNIQVILGSNGSGKSSLFKELSPLPAEIKKNYNEGGYKEIHIEHHNSTYVLTSGKTAPSKHSFIKDDIELNDGGTRAVQLELVKEHFNITPPLMELLLGVENFTRLSPADRKHWLSQCSTIDYTYPISVYMKLKTRYRDLQGGIKLIQDQIVKNQSICKDEKEIEKLKEDKKFLEEFTTYLYSLYVHNVKEMEFESYRIELVATTRRLNNVLATINNKIDIQELDNALLLKRQELEYKNKEIAKLSSLLTEKDKLKSSSSKEDILRQIELLKSQQVTIEPIIVLEDYKQAYNDLRSMYSDLVDLFTKLEEYDRVRVLPPEKITAQIERIAQYDFANKQRELKIDTLRKDIAHMESHIREDNKTTCPSCLHLFYVNYDPKLLEQYKQELDYLSKIEPSEEEIWDRKDAELLEAYTTWKSNLKTLLSYHPRLRPVWEYFLSQIDFRTVTSASVITLLEKISKYLQDQSEQVKIQEEITKLQSTLKEIEEMESLSKSLGLDNIANLEKQLEDIVDYKRKLIIEIEQLEKQKQSYNELEPLYNRLKSLLGSLSISNEIKFLRNQSLLDLVTYFKKELVNVDTALTEHYTHIGKLQKDKELLEEYKNAEHVLKLMLKELSPSEGLIAKSMNSFINSFIQEMNDIINSIWSYSMEILPCELTEENDLNYKFQVLVNNDEVIEDISKLSSSMQEIVNLAFRILLCRYLDLKEVPLYLDEFGSTFDSKHRVTAYRVIDKIISSDFKQIFMICHYESLYGSLQNADFNVLNNDNIELDTSIEINKHLKKY